MLQLQSYTHSLTILVMTAVLSLYKMHINFLAL